MNDTECDRRRFLKVTNNMKQAVTLVLGLVLLAVGARAQDADVRGQLGYPQMIVYNGKIGTMDDSSFESKVGTIVKAMAIRDGKILAVGWRRGRSEMGIHLLSWSLVSRYSKRETQYWW